MIFDNCNKDVGYYFVQLHHKETSDDLEFQTQNERLKTLKIHHK